ncbi:hypothetical protein RFN58_35095 [Streptomyces iakyrus]|uniref:hypothetical protein n=1 Tax=Streptomyces iakyrus TaxID=68219 RepID=UPI0005272B7E|nr:hypothetical protein [Streptomyces iakyrus]
MKSGWGMTAGAHAVTAYVLPLLATAAAFALTYVLCMRPMRTDAEIKRLREEVQLLHHELDLRSGTAEPTPGDRLRKGEAR